MHELAVTEEILRLAMDIAKKEDASQVTDIYLEIGKLSGIVDESVEFYWKEICKETICKDAVLHFEFVPASLLCRSCDHEFKLEHDLIPCPQCGSMDLRIITGEEFLLKSIELEK